MQFSEYLANGGLERLLIIIGAMLLGYWGYRLHTAAQRTGLALLALSAAVLLAVLLTSTTRLARDDARTAVAPPASGEPPPPTLTLPAADERIPEAADASVASEPGEPEEVATTGGEEPPAERTPPLANGDELGGRITSVRGGNVSLEWSRDETRPVRSSSPP